VVCEYRRDEIGGDVMKSMISVGVLVVSLALVCTSAYAGRVANTAIGTLAGLVVFGPVGAVAGAAVGYTAGHGIARSWGISRPPHRPSESFYSQSRAMFKGDIAGWADTAHSAALQGLGARIAPSGSGRVAKGARCSSTPAQESMAGRGRRVTRRTALPPSQSLEFLSSAGRPRGRKGR
jgi:hypothetical protein